MTTRHDSRWQLSDGALQRLLMRLDVDPERAGEQYEALRRTLLKYFEWRGALEPDTCADETLDRVARKIEQGAEAADLRAFAYGVARLIVLERARSIETHHVTIDDVSRTLAAPEPATDTPMMTCLDRCLAELPDASRTIILAYYADERRTKIDGRQQLARELGVTPVALRNRAQRLRDRLGDCILRCERAGARLLPIRKARESWRMIANGSSSNISSADCLNRRCRRSNSRISPTPPCSSASSRRSMP